MQKDELSIGGGDGRGGCGGWGEVQWGRGDYPGKAHERQKESKTEKQACIWSKRAEEEEFEDVDMISVDRNIRSRKIHMKHNYDLLRS